MSTSVLHNETDYKHNWKPRRKSATPVPCFRGLPFKPKQVPIQYGRQPSRRAVKSPRISSCRFMQRYVNQVQEEEIWNSSQELSEYDSQIASQNSESTLISASQKYTKTSEDDFTTQLSTQFTTECETQPKCNTTSMGNSSDYITCSTMDGNTDQLDSMSMKCSKESFTGPAGEWKEPLMSTKEMLPLQKELFELESIEIPRKQADLETSAVFDISPVRASLSDEINQVNNKRRRQRRDDTELLSQSFDFIEASSEDFRENKCSTKVKDINFETLPYPDLSSVRDEDGKIFTLQQKILETTPQGKSLKKCPRRGHRDAKRDRLKKISKILTSSVVNTGRTCSTPSGIIPADVSISSVKADIMTPSKDADTLQSPELYQSISNKNKMRKRLTSTPMKTRVEDGLLKLMSLDVSSVYRDDSELTDLGNDSSRYVNSQEIVALSQDETTDGKNLFSKFAEKRDSDLKNKSQSEIVSISGERVQKAKEVLDRETSRIITRRAKKTSKASKPNPGVLQKENKKTEISPRDYPPCFLTTDEIDYPSHLSAKVLVCTRPRKYFSYDQMVRHTPVVSSA